MKQLHPKAVWLFFIKNIFGFLFLYFFLGFMGVSALLAITEGNYGIFSGLYLSTFIPIIIIPILAYFWAKLSYRFYKYGLTFEGIKIERGVIWKRYITIPYGRIQNVDIYRGPLARMLGLSDLQIQTAGYAYRKAISTEGRLPGLALKDAEALRDELIKKVESKSQGL